MSTSEQVTEDFKRIYKELTDTEFRDEAKRKKEREIRIAARRSDAGL